MSHLVCDNLLWQPKQTNTGCKWLDLPTQNWCRKQKGKCSANAIWCSGFYSEVVTCGRSSHRPKGMTTEKPKMIFFKISSKYYKSSSKKKTERERERNRESRREKKEKFQEHWVWKGLYSLMPIILTWKFIMPI